MLMLTRVRLFAQSLVKSESECPYDMREAVCTLIWAASRTELTEVKKQLTKKYGQDFEAAAMRNVDACVNERVIQKLSVRVGAVRHTPCRLTLRH
jgi:vacuolar protein sorting-associated protein IST1